MDSSSGCAITSKTFLPKTLPGSTNTHIKLEKTYLKTKYHIRIYTDMHKHNSLPSSKNAALASWKDPQKNLQREATQSTINDMMMISHAM